MPVQVRCPACRAGVIVGNANYLVFLHCHACGEEFMADAADLAMAEPVSEADDAGSVEWPAREEPSVLTFCPMCGELAPESAPTCHSCGEPLPVDPAFRQRPWEPAPENARRFRRNARWLGLLWILLAYVLSAEDFWIGGRSFALPIFLGGDLTIPKIPVLTTVLVCLGAFALVGQFWAVAVGGLLNYLILFIVVWRANVLSLCLLAVSILLTHVVLHQASSARAT